MVFTLPANLPEWLAERMQLPLPGRLAQRPFAPELAYGRHFGPRSFDARDAAVVALFYRNDDQWRIPLTLRPQSLPAHSGQVCLPGGLIEAGESPGEAALRELHEEIGVPSASVQLLGSLTPLYLYNSNFHVLPWIAVANKPFEFRPDAAEVAELIELPATALVDQTLRGQRVMDRGGIRFAAPHFAWGAHRVWGATAIILGELSALLAAAVSPD